MAALDATQLAELAALIGGPVPAAYQAFMAAYPPALATRTYAGLTRRVAAHELHDDPSAVVKANRDVRAFPCWGDEGESPWEDARLVIGKDLSGDVIVLDTAADDGVIHRYLCETGGVIAVAPDLATYATMLATDDPTLRRS
jgi:hypothetical protein